MANWVIVLLYFLTATLVAVLFYVIDERTGFWGSSNYDDRLGASMMVFLMWPLAVAIGLIIGIPVLLYVGLNALIDLFSKKKDKPNEEKSDRC